MTTPQEPADLSPKAERAVARQFMGRIQWEMILIGIGQAATWMAALALTIAGVIPLWAGFIVSTACMCLAYLPSHEGQHGNLSGRHTKWKWIDPAVSQISLLGLKQSHAILRATHLKHHAYTNNPELDPDFHSIGEHWWQPALSIHQKKQSEIVARHAQRDERFAAAIGRGLPVAKAISLVQLILVVFFPLEVLFVWWLPSKIGFSYIYVFFAWEPHRPGTETGRYTSTRFWNIPLVPRFLIHSMQTHVIHHLYPTIPHWDEPAAMEALRPFMIDRGVPGASDIPERVRWNPLIGPLRQR